MKKFTLALSGFIIMNFGTISVSAQKLIRRIESFNTLHTGGITPPFAMIVNKYDSVVNLGGWLHDSVLVFDSQGKNIVQRLYAVNNIIQKMPDDTWKNGPPTFTPFFSMEAEPPPVYGMQLLSTVASPYALSYNSGSNSFDSLRGISFSNGYFQYAFEMGNDDVLFLSRGDGGSFSEINGETYRLAVIWNKTTHAVRHTLTPDGFEGLPGWIMGAYQSHDTVFIGSRGLSDGKFKMYALKSGTTQWIRVYPSIACWDAWALTAIGGTPYAVIETLTGQYQVYKLVDGSWQKLIDAHAVHPGTVFPIKGIMKYKGTIVMGADVDQANGVAVNGIISFDESTTTVANLVPSLPFTMDHCIGIYAIDSELYVPSSRGSIGSGLNSQTLYVLKDTVTGIGPPPALPVPIITNPKNGSTTSDTIVVVSGTDSVGVPGLSVEILEGTTVLGSVTVSNTGTWSFSGSFVPGAHTITARSKDTFAKLSASSATVTFTVPQPLVVLPIPQITFPVSGTTIDHPTVTLKGVVNGGSDLSVEITLADGTSIGTVPVDDAGDWSLQGTFVPGKYTFTARSIKLGNVSGLSNAVMVTILAAPPSDSTAVVRHPYPNPATDFTRVPDAKKILFVSTTTGTQMPIGTPQRMGADIVLFVSAYPNGWYVVVGEGNDGKTFTVTFEVLH